MGYDRLGSDRGGTSRGEILQDRQSNVATSSTRRKSTVKLLVIIAAVLIVTAAVSVGVLVGVRGRGSRDRITARPSQAMARTCGKTLYPSLCLSSLLDFPGALSASDGDLVHISVNMTLQRFGKALYTVTDFNNLQMGTLVRSAYEDCLELLEDSMDLLDRSLSSIQSGGGGNSQDVMTWLSAALTNQDTCTEGFSDANGPVKDQVTQRLKDLSELVSNSLAIFAAANGGDDFSGIPIQHRRKLLDHRDAVLASDDDDFPKWLSESDRKLLSTAVSPIQADIIVAKDGTGTVKTITEAIKKVPEHSTRRIVIYIKAGV